MPSLPYIQLYVADYLSDTAHLTTEEHGAYLLLIMNYWQRGKALDNSNNRLANVARLSVERWIEVSKTLSEYFVIESEQWTHTRIESDLARVDEVVNARSRAGLRSAEARLERKNTSSTSVEHNGNHKIRIDKIRKDKIDTYTEDFINWWSIYPRRDGSKRKAYELFTRALSKTSLETLICKATEYANDPNRDPAFTALATTWLNQERWESEALPPRTSQALTRHSIQAQQAIALANQYRDEE